MTTQCLRRSISDFARVAIVCVLTAAALLAQGFANKDHFDKAFRSHTGNPKDVDFDVRLAGGRKTFRQGEPVELALVFSSPTEDKYYVYTSSSDQIRQEGLSIQPQTGWADPNERYEAIRGGRFGGGIGGVGFVGPDGQTVHIDLNRLVRFDRPGSYRVRVASTRLHRGFDPERDAQSRQPMVLISRPISLTITAAEPAWLQKQVVEATGVLSSESALDERVDAARRLAYLPGRKAVTAIIDHLGESDRKIRQWLRFGLTGTAEAEFVRQTLEARLGDPDQPVSHEYLTAWLASAASARAQAENLDVARDMYLYWKRMGEWRNELGLRAAEAVRAKRGRARAVTLKTVISGQFSSTGVGSAKLHQAAGGLRAEVAGILEYLDPEEQRDLIANRWQLIRHSNLTPVLKKLYLEQDAPEDSASQPYTKRAARTAALQRLSELDPGWARAAVIREAENPPHSVDVEGLLALPDALLPEIDSALLNQLAAGHVDRRAPARLLHRYATDDAYKPLRQHYVRAGLDPCAVPTGVYAYFLRVDAEWTLELLRSILLGAGTESGQCGANLLMLVGQLQPDPGLAKLAIEMLRSDNLPLAVSGANWLARDESDGALEALWAALESWNDRWRDHEDQLAKRNQDENVRARPVEFEMALVRAIQSQEGSNASLPRLHQLCVSQYCRRETEAFR